MNVFIVMVLFSTTSAVIGQHESAWQEPVSGSDSIKQSYGPAPVNAPPSSPTIVTVPKTATAAATAYSAAIGQSAAAGPIQFPDKTEAVKTPLMPYSFEYGVDDVASGLDFGHKESSDGAVVTGTYYVLLPDGRMETVNYKADDNGYVAEVSYEGEAKYDTVQTPNSGAMPSDTSGQLQASSNSGGLSVSVPSSRPSQPLSVPSGLPKAPTPQTTAPAKAPFQEVVSPVWPAVKAPVVPIAPIVAPTPSVVPATSFVVNVPAPVPVNDPVPTSVLASNRAASSATAPQFSQAPAVQIPVIPEGYAPSPNQPRVQAIAYGQAGLAVAAPSTISAYPVAPIPLTQRYTPKPPFYPYSV